MVFRRRKTYSGKFPENETVAFVVTLVDLFLVTTFSCLIWSNFRGISDPLSSIMGQIKNAGWNYHPVALSALKAEASLLQISGFQLLSFRTWHKITYTNIPMGDLQAKNTRQPPGKNNINSLVTPRHNLEIAAAFIDLNLFKDWGKVQKTKQFLPWKCPIFQMVKKGGGSDGINRSSELS